MSSFSLFSFVVVVGAVQGLLLIVALNRIEGRNKSANNILSVFIGLISLVLISRLVYGEGVEIWETYPHLFLIPDMPLLLYGPFFYFYIKKLLLKSDESTGFRSMWVHFIPALLHWALMAFYLFEGRAKYYDRLVTNDLIEVPFVNILSLGHIAVYLFLSFRIYRRYRSSISKEFSFTYPFGFLNTFFVLSALCWAAWGYSVVAPYLPLLQQEWINYNASWVALSFVTYTLAYYGISQQDIFKVHDEPRKYSNSHVSSKELDALMLKLKELLKNEKPYLNSSLTITDLAGLMNVHAKKLSQLINERFDMNFFDLINYYRVEEFKRIVVLDQYRKHTLLAVAFEAGFNSKSTFNAAFKKITGVTPSQYVKSAR